MMLLGLAPGFLRAGECTTLPRSELKIYRLAAPPVAEHAASGPEIVRMREGAGPPPHRLLAMAYALDGQVRLLHHVVPTPGGYCDAPTTVAVYFGVARRDIFLTTEAAAEPCIRKALLAHERDHAQLVDAAAHAFIRERQDALAQALAQAEHQAAPTDAEARRAMETGLYGTLRLFAAEFARQTRGPLRQAADTPAALARLRASCHGTLGTMEKAAAAPGVPL